MNTEKIFKDILIRLSDIYQNEGSQTGSLTAEALSLASNQVFDLKENEHEELSKFFNSFISNDDHMLAQQIKEISNFLPWHHSSMGGRIEGDLKKQFIQSVLLGPSGIIKSNDYEVGIFMQMANIDYSVRRHPAEETFFIISGKGYFNKDHHPEIYGEVGDYIHNPSMINHSNRTEEHHMIWSWRWSGDISLDSYIKNK
jgi:mannose-6-phosphate isomerase-like protein (cupin superfamily)